MEEGRIVEQATPTPVKPVGNYGTATSPARPGDKIVLRALNVIAVASPCRRYQIPLDDFHPRGPRRLVGRA
jgi:uncharacterized protein YcgI (DUF1989 family)